MALTTVDEIVDRVLATVQDSEANDPADILASLNRCNYSIAREIKLNDLATSDEVVTSTTANYVGLPGDFHSHLVYCRNNDVTRRVRVYGSKRIIQRRLASLDRSGEVHSVARDGGSLYYQDIPSTARGLQVFYHKVPDTLVAGGDLPSYLPEDMAFKMFYNFACAEAYSTIEQGPEGEKISTLYHETRWKEGLAEAKLFFGPDEDDPFTMEDTYFLFNFSLYE